MSNNKKQSQALERRVQGYPPPKYSELVKAYSKVNEMPVSQVVTVAIKNFFDTMPADERRRVMNQSKHSY